MPDLTTRYGLKKPVQDGSETADLRVWVGENMDLLDVAIGHVEDKADAAGQAAATAQQTANAAQQAASAAQAAADAAQETADAALSAANVAQSAAQAAQSTADAAQAAITSHANAAAPHSGHAKLAGENTFTARQTFTAGIQDGDSNQDVSLVYSVQHQAHTRSTVLTYENGRLTKVEEKDGGTVVKSATLNYDSNGRLSSVVETAGGITRTSTLNYDANGNLTSVTRA